MNFKSANKSFLEVSSRFPSKKQKTQPLLIKGFLLIILWWFQHSLFCISCISDFLPWSHSSLHIAPNPPDKIRKSWHLGKPPRHAGHHQNAFEPDAANRLSSRPRLRIQEGQTESRTETLQNIREDQIQVPFPDTLAAAESQYGEQKGGAKKETVAAEVIAKFTQKGEFQKDGEGK